MMLEKHDERLPELNWTKDDHAVAIYVSYPLASELPEGNRSPADYGYEFVFFDDGHGNVDDVIINEEPRGNANDIAGFGFLSMTATQVKDFLQACKEQGYDHPNRKIR